VKLVTYSDNGAQRLGAIRDDQIVDLARSADAAAPFASMLDLIRSGDAGLDLARTHLNSPSAVVAGRLGEVKLLAPLPVPEQVRCFSAFEGHVRNSGKAMLKKMAALAADPAAEEARLEATGNFAVPPLFYERPLYYKGNRFNWGRA
jgi:hypothetical protein